MIIAHLCLLRAAVPMILLEMNDRTIWEIISLLSSAPVGSDSGDSWHVVSSWTHNMFLLIWCLNVLCPDKTWDAHHILNIEPRVYIEKLELVSDSVTNNVLLFVHTIEHNFLYIAFYTKPNGWICWQLTDDQNTNDAQAKDSYSCDKILKVQPLCINPYIEL